MYPLLWKDIILGIIQAGNIRGHKLASIVILFKYGESQEMQQKKKSMLLIFSLI